jgi:cell division protein FtsL
VAAARPAGRSTISVAGPVLLGLLFVAVLGVVVFQTLLVQSQSRLDDLDVRIAAEQQRADDLRVELAALQSPERIAAEARARLGMVSPEEVLYIQHDPDHDRAGTAPDGAGAGG